MLECPAITGLVNGGFCITMVMLAVPVLSTGALVPRAVLPSKKVMVVLGARQGRAAVSRGARRQAANLRGQCDGSAVLGSRRETAQALPWSCLVHVDRIRATHAGREVLVAEVAGRDVTVRRTAQSR